MPRQLRIEYPGAFYHVYSRGNQKQAIFFSDEDRYYFLKILRDANERLGGKKASRVGILGDGDFIDKIRRAYLKGRMENPDEELCELRRLKVRPELARIEAEVDGELGAKNRLSKKCTIFLAHKHANYKLREIGDFFGISPTAVSVSFRKTAREIVSSETLRRVVETVVSRLSEVDEKPQKGLKV